MSASHNIVAALGIVACLGAYPFISVYAEVLGADASDAPYAGVWVYTPYADPGGRAAAKIFLQGGDGVMADNVEARIDGNPAAVEDMKTRDRRPSRRNDMGKLEIELSVVVPPDLAPGPHTLGFSLDGRCAGSSFSRACGRVDLQTGLDVGSTGMRLWAVLRALFAALAVWLTLRYARRPVIAWLNDAGRSGKVLGAAAIALFVAWGASSYALFARPLAAGVGTSSDVFFGAAIVAWLLVLPVGLLWKRRDPTLAANSEGVLRFVAEAGAEASGYRDAATSGSAPRTLDDIARAIASAHHIRLRRSGNRLVRRWIGGAPIGFVADGDAGPGRGVVRVRGNFGYIVLCSVAIAKELGPLDLELDGRTARVGRDAAAQAIAQTLRPAER